MEVATTYQEHSGSAESRIRVAVADDHPIVREGLTKAINGTMGMEACGQADTVVEMFQIAEKKTPHVVVADISFGEMPGLKLVEKLHAAYPELRMLVFSMHDERIYAEQALRAGAQGYVMKSSPTQQLIDGIRAVARQEVFLSQRMASRVLEISVRGYATPSFAVDRLTDREMEVFQLLGEGHGVRDIADQLDLSRKTIETYRRRVKEKLRLDTVMELLQYAIRWTYS